MAIKFDNKAPEWDNVGAEPDAELKKGGFLAGYKPPAAYFNWFFNRTYECVKELQEKLVSSLKSLAFKDKVGDDDITAVAANKVTQDSKHRMITDAERSTWNGKADASGGDVSEMTVKTLETITTEFPVPVAGESTKTFLGKVKKFFEDTKNWMTGVCLIGSIVNNCVTDNARLPLSAAQGKVLMDLYTVLNTKIACEELDLSAYGITSGQAIRINNVVIITFWHNTAVPTGKAMNAVALPDDFKPTTNKVGTAVYMDSSSAVALGTSIVKPDGYIYLDSAITRVRVEATIAYTIK